MLVTRAGARSVHGVRVHVHRRPRARCVRASEIGAAPEYLSSGSPNCTGGRHRGTPGARQHGTNYGPILLTFQPTRTVTRGLAQSVEIADESVDCMVARFLN